MEMTRTDKALRLVAQGYTPYAAARQVGISTTTVYVAIKRRAGKVMCPCCGSLVDAAAIKPKGE